MRKSKYDEAFPSQPISEKEKQSSEIDKRIELSSEIINLNQQIDSIKKLSKDLKVLGTLVEKFAKYCKSFAKKLFGAAIIRE